MAIVMSCSSATAIANLYEKDTTLPSGRKLYRHTTLPGSVLCFNDGVDRQVLVLDAKYRIGANDTQKKWGWFGDRHNGNYVLNAPINWNFSDLPDYPNVLDSTLDSKIRDSYTSRAQTSCLIAPGYKDGYPPEAAQYCRSVIISDSISCDLPNINTLMRIYVERTYIDELDPTLEEYPNRSLEKIWEEGGVWSSTGSTSAEAYMIEKGGIFNKYMISEVGCVIPICEPQ